MDPSELRAPPYEVVPPGDTLGVRHVEVALSDLPFPARTSEIRDRAGAWRMPLDGATFVPLAELLDGVRERTFRNAHEVALAIERAHREMKL